MSDKAWYIPRCRFLEWINPGKLRCHEREKARERERERERERGRERESEREREREREGERERASEGERGGPASLAARVVVPVWIEQGVHAVSGR